MRSDPTQIKSDLQYYNQTGALWDLIAKLELQPSLDAARSKQDKDKMDEEPEVESQTQAEAAEMTAEGQAVASTEAWIHRGHAGERGGSFGGRNHGGGWGHHRHGHGFNGGEFRRARHHGFESYNAMPFDDIRRPHGYGGRHGRDDPGSEQDVCIETALPFRVAKQGRFRRDGAPCHTRRDGGEKGSAAETAEHIGLKHRGGRGGRFRRDGVEKCSAEDSDGFARHADWHGAGHKHRGQHGFGSGDRGSGSGCRGFGRHGHAGFGGSTGLKGSRGWLNMVKLAELLQAQMFDGDGLSRAMGESKDSDFVPAVDVFDTELAFVVHASLAGIHRDDVALAWDAQKSELSITGVMHRPGDEEFLKTIAVTERRVGSFKRKVRLGSEAAPALVDAEGISAKLQEGVLVVSVPKADKEFEVIHRE